METKRLIISLTLITALVIGWQLMVTHLEALHPNWRPQATAEPAATSPQSSPATTQSLVATGGATQPGAMDGSAAATQPTGLAAVSATAPVGVTMGTDANKYPMILSIDPQGAGLQSIILNDFYETAQHQKKYEFQKPVERLESQTRPLATQSIKIGDAAAIDIASSIWTKVSSTDSTATYSTVISDATHPVLELTKTFTLLPRKDPSQGFEIALHQGFRNLSTKEMNFAVTINGPTAPARENDRSEDRRYVCGYDAGDKWVDTGGSQVGDLKRDKPPVDLVTADKRQLLWVGACSSYFEAIFRPDYAGVTGKPDIAIASALTSALDVSTIAGSDPVTALSITTTSIKLPVGANQNFDAKVFFGPKKRDLFKDADYYSAFPREYDKTLVYTSGWCGFITWSWLINLLYGILAFFHMIFRDWGLAIIGLVCLVRLMLHPITKRSQINMLQMGKMGPEIERLKKKYGDNKDELNKAMMGVYKEQGLTPILGCLPMFLQTPIWIALWNALQSTFELRQAGFLRWSHLHLTWIADLSHPDALISFAPISLPFGYHFQQINILPLLLAGVFFLQQTMTPAPSNMTPEQEQQRKMMRWMSLLFPVMLYAGPSGLNLYILTSTTIGIIESKIIRDHIKQREAAEKSGQIIIDAPPTRGNKKNKNLDFNKPKPPKKTGFSAWLADLQAKAEQVRREAERRGKDRA